MVASFLRCADPYLNSMYWQEQEEKRNVHELGRLGECKRTTPSEMGGQNARVCEGEDGRMQGANVRIGINGSSSAVGVR